MAEQIDEKTDAAIDAAARAAYAGSVKMQAIAMRSQADLLWATATTLDEQARAVEEGRVDPPAPGRRLAIVEEEPAGEPEEREAVATDALLPVARREGRLVAVVSDGEDDRGKAMVEWLHRFDDRITGSKWFEEAVNEAADRGLLANDDTARLVAARVEELRATALKTRGAEGPS